MKPARILLLLLSALIAAGCARHDAAMPPPSDVAARPAAVAEDMAVNKEDVAVNETSQERDYKPLSGPTLTPEQVWDKLFALIESLHSEADLTRENVEQAIGLPLARMHDQPYKQIISGETTAGWQYAFDLLNFSSEDIRTSLVTYNPDRDDQGNSPTCTFRLQDLRAELKRRGFDERDMTAEADLSFSWQFSRLPMTVNVNYYFGGKKFDYGNTCVGIVEMAFVIPNAKE